MINQSLQLTKQIKLEPFQGLASVVAETSTAADSFDGVTEEAIASLVTVKEVRSIVMSRVLQTIS